MWPLLEVRADGSVAEVARKPLRLYPSWLQDGFPHHDHDTVLSETGEQVGIVPPQPDGRPPAFLRGRYATGGR